MLAEAFALDGARSPSGWSTTCWRTAARAGSGCTSPGPDDAAALLSLQVAADVFLGAFGNTADLLRAEYAPLFPAMTHVVVLDSVTRTAVGSLILQAAPAEELKTVVDAARPPWSMPVDRTLGALGLQRGARTGADLLLLAVRPGLPAARTRAAAHVRRLDGVAGARHRPWTAILDDSLLLRHEPHDRRSAATRSTGRSPRPTSGHRPARRSASG